MPAKLSAEAKPGRRTATTVLLTILVVLISAQILNFHPDCLVSSAATFRPVLTEALVSASQQGTNSANPQIEDLAWFVPKPDKPRIMGWEDDWMIQFKSENYDQSQTLDLFPSTDHPYGGDQIVCHIPAYVPARWPVTSPQKIPRVIFLSWKLSTLNVEACMSIKTILNHHPEYELIFMNDTNVDRFVCENYPANAPNFGQLRAGAARCDAWRMLAIHRYGGVYFDLDMSATSHLRIPANASVYSGLGGWTHLPTDKDTGIDGGVLEHWALAFVPKHNLIRKTLQLIWENLKNPDNEYLNGEKYIERATSITVRLTGPSVYQRALRYLVSEKSSCKGDDMMTILEKPEDHCNMTAFQEEFGNMVVTPQVPMGYALIEKKLRAAVYWNGEDNDYDGDNYKFLKDPQPAFCSNVDERAAAADKEYQDAIKRSRDEIRKMYGVGGDQNSGDDGEEDNEDKDEGEDDKGDDGKKNEDDNSEEVKNTESTDDDEKGEASKGGDDGKEKADEGDTAKAVDGGEKDEVSKDGDGDKDKSDEGNTSKDEVNKADKDSGEKGEVRKDDDGGKEKTDEGNTERGEVKQDDEQLDDKQRAEQKRKKKMDEERQRENGEDNRNEVENAEPSKVDEKQDKEKKTTDAANKDGQLEAKKKD